MTKGYIWKLLKNDELREIQTYGPYYDEFKLNEGPFTSIEDAEAALEEYYKKYCEQYGYGGFCNYEDFVLLTVYSAE